MKRRGFIATLLGAVTAPALPLPAALAISTDPVIKVEPDKARFERWVIAFDWPHDQRRIDFIVKGKITGFNWGTSWNGPVWHLLDYPMMIGDTVLVRKPVQLRPIANLSPFTWEPDIDQFEQITFTPEFLKANGFRRPTVAEQYAAGRIGEPVGFKWQFMDFECKIAS